MGIMEWLGSLSTANDEINSLTDQLQSARSEAERYRANAVLWKNAARQMQSELDAQAPMVEFAMKRKASLADYEKKRGR